MYSQLQVKRIIHIEPETDKQTKTVTGRFFIKAVAANGKTYQVKLTRTGEKANINELISNYIGKIMQAPVLDGAFLVFSKAQLDKLAQKIVERFPKTPLPDMSSVKNNTLFGIEWQNDIIPLTDTSELEVLLTKVSNPKSFYSLYPYDQYLKNFDRHIENHIIIKDDGKKPSYYGLIDGDRIFGSLNWKLVEALSKNFACLKAQGANWHNYLYNLIDDKKYSEILSYSVNINNISDKQIETLLLIIDHYYVIDKKDLAIIASYLIDRKSEFYSVCVNNSTCFPNITQTRAL